MTPPNSSPNSKFGSADSSSSRVGANPYATTGSYVKTGLPNDKLSTSGSSPESPSRLVVSPFGKVILGADLLLCLFNIFAFGWMVYKLYVIQDVNYSVYSMFVNSGIIVTAIVGFFGVTGNLTMLAGQRVGTRFAWYRITLGFATVVWLLSMMFLLLPGKSLLSEANQSTYLMFLPPSLLYGLWMISYTVCILLVARRVRR